MPAAEMQHREELPGLGVDDRWGDAGRLLSASLDAIARFAAALSAGRSHG